MGLCVDPVSLVLLSQRLIRSDIPDLKLLNSCEFPAETQNDYDAPVLMKCPMQDAPCRSQQGLVYLSGDSRAGGARCLLLLLKEASLPGHLVQQEQGPLGHVRRPRYI